MAVTVRALSTTPVKGTRIHGVDAIELGPQGACGDRVFYVIDADGAMVNAKRIGDLQAVEADLSDPPNGPAQLRLSFPDGREVAAPARLGPRVATTFFGEPRPARVLDGPWSDALSTFVGIPLRLVDGGAAVDRGTVGGVSLVSNGSLRRLAQQDDGRSIDARRFRMLIEVDGLDAHAEDAWVGREVAIGDEVRIRFVGHVGRCVITTRHPDTGAVDRPILKLLAGYRRDGATRTEGLCFGIHGTVLAGGPVRVGDLVRLLDE